LKIISANDTRAQQQEEAQYRGSNEIANSDSSNNNDNDNDNPWPLFADAGTSNTLLLPLSKARKNHLATQKTMNRRRCHLASQNEIGRRMDNKKLLAGGEQDRG
jgi:hypothetical protein